MYAFYPILVIVNATYVTAKKRKASKCNNNNITWQFNMLEGGH